MNIFICHVFEILPARNRHHHHNPPPHHRHQGKLRMLVADTMVHNENPLHQPCHRGTMPTIPIIFIFIILEYVIPPPAPPAA